MHRPQRYACVIRRCLRPVYTPSLSLSVMHRHKYMLWPSVSKLENLYAALFFCNIGTDFRVVQGSTRGTGWRDEVRALHRRPYQVRFTCMHSTAVAQAGLVHIRFSLWNTTSALTKRSTCDRYCRQCRNKTKWAFCCRPTVLTLGMVATQRTEGRFRVAKRSGVEKTLATETAR